MSTSVERLSPVLQDVSDEPPTPLGSSDTSSTYFRRKAILAGAASGVTGSRSPGTSDAKPVSAGTDEEFAWSSSSGESASSDKLSGSALGKSPGKHAAMTALEVSGHVMRGDLEVAIRDVQRCRSLTWISQEMRIQLGRCLYELTLARRMAP